MVPSAAQEVSSLIVFLKRDCSSTTKCPRNKKVNHSFFSQQVSFLMIPSLSFLGSFLGKECGTDQCWVLCGYDRTSLLSTVNSYNFT